MNDDINDYSCSDDDLDRALWWICASVLLAVCALITAIYGTVVLAWHGYEPRLDVLLWASVASFLASRSASHIAHSITGPKR